MARPASTHPTELELAMLKIIWRDGPSTVRDICDALKDTRPPAFTSAITTMNIMVKKGYLSAQRRSRAQGGTIYRAMVAEAATAFKMMNSLARRLFGGSLTTAVNSLLVAGEITPQELQELRQIVSPKRK